MIGFGMFGSAFAQPVTEAYLQVCQLQHYPPSALRSSTWQSSRSSTLSWVPLMLVPEHTGS
jgi:hypothetical protein